MDKKNIFGLCVISALLLGAHSADASMGKRIGIYKMTRGGFCMLLSISTHAIAKHIAHGTFLGGGPVLADGLLE